MYKLSTLVLISFLIFSSIACEQIKDIIPIGGDDPAKASGFENLGSGYDAFDNYADVEKVKAKILDTEALNADGLVEKKTLEKSVFETSSGSSISQYSSSLEVKASLEGDYMFFSGAVKTNFSESRYTSEEYSFATVHSSINKYILRVELGTTGEDLIPYLTTQASSSINDMSLDPHLLFDTYGTHCMVGIIIGGRLDYNISARSSDISGSKSIGVYASASFKNTFSSVSASTETLSESEWASYNSSKEEKLEIYGGASEYGQFIINDGQYNSWIESISDNLVFSDFTSSDALIPIWEFCNTQERKNQLMAGFETWAEARKIYTTPAAKNCIISVGVRNSDGNNLGDNYIENGLTYNKLDVDLNSDAGGDWIFVYYAIGLDDGSSGFPPINDLYTWDP